MRAGGISIEAVGSITLLTQLLFLVLRPTECQRSVTVGRRSGTLSGQLRVFAPVSLGRAWIIPRLADFMHRYPHLDVHLLLDDRVRDLIEERLDVGIRIGPLQDSSLRMRPLGEVGYSIVATPAFWKQHGKPATPAALAGLPAVIFDGTIRADRFTVTDGACNQLLQLTGRLSTNSSEGVLAALEAGLGYCVAPEWLVSIPVAQGRLELALTQWWPDRRLAVLAVFPGGRVPTERVRRFVDWLAFVLLADGLVSEIDG